MSLNQFDIQIDYEDDDEYMEDEEDDEDALEYGDTDVIEAAAEDQDEIEGLQEDTAQAVNDVLNGDAQPVATIDTGSGIVHLSIRDILRLLAAQDNNVPSVAHRRRDAEPVIDFAPITVPEEKGLEMLMGGEFGRVSSKREPTMAEKHLSRSILDRRARQRPTSKEDMSSHIVPNSNGVAVAQYDSSAYAGQFSADSSFYYTCCQDWQLHVYDMTVAHTPWDPKSRRNRTSDHETTMTVIKDIDAVPGRWTITDSHLSPDNQRMIYSSITSTVYMTNTLDSSPEQTPIEFADRRPTTNASLWEERFGIWSCRFSADGNEVVAGGNGKIFVYDLLADKRTVKISAHDDDVNSCCFADDASNILISASDDTFLKVWDRRSLGGSRKPAGVLVGHTEGITNVSAKGDGRYVISNGKDQALRLWDLRSMCSSAEFDGFHYPPFGDPSFDYRYGAPPRIRRAAHPQDCSVMAYRGHSVLQTLIRCYFSPNETTGGRYIYSGSSDGRIHIWSLDGRVVQVLDRSATLPMAYDPSEPEPPALPTRRQICVRDVSWHTQQPVLMSVGWASRNSGSIVARHEWKGLGKLGNHLEDWVDKQSAEYKEKPAQSTYQSAAAAATAPESRSSRARTIPGAYEDDDDDDEWTDEE